MANFADLLKKIANNAKLTPQELDELGRFGTEIQSRNALVAGWEKESFTNSDPTLRQYDFRTLGAKVSRTGTYAIPTATLVLFPWTNVDYYDTDMVNLTLSDTKINIPRTGRYVVGVNFALESVSTSYWVCDILVNGVGLASSVTNQPAGFGPANYSEDALLNKGDYVQARVAQSTGSSKNVLGANMYVRWLGVN